MSRRTNASVMDQASRKAYADAGIMPMSEYVKTADVKKPSPRDKPEPQRPFKHRAMIAAICLVGAFGLAGLIALTGGY